MALKVFDRIAAAARAAVFGFKSADIPGYLWTPGQAHWSEWNFEAFAREAYRGNPYGFAAIRMVITAAAAVPLLIYQKRGADEQEAGPDHGIRRLLQTPNERHGWHRFLMGWAGARLLGGQGYAYGVGPEQLKPGQKPSQSKPPRELWALRPDKVAVNTGTNVGDVLSFTYSPKGEERVISASQMLWLCGWDPLDDSQGLPPAAAAGKGFDVNNEAMGYNKAILGNGGMPGLVFKAPPGEDQPVFRNDRAREEYLKKFDMGYRGEGRGRSLVLYGGMSVDPVGFSPKDMQFKDALEVSATQIGLVYGVAPELLGIASQKTYSNVREARAALYQETVLPLLAEICGELTRFWKPWDDTVRVTFDPDAIDALAEEQDKKWTRITAADDLTINEKREARGYAPIPGGDVVLVPAGKIPLDVATGAPPTDGSAV